MGDKTMGRVAVVMKIENLDDLFMAQKGLLSVDKVRSIEVPDALVDTGAVMLSLPKRFIAQLGLREHRKRTLRTTNCVVERGIYEPVRMTVQGRDCIIEVAELPDDCPVLLGQVPLELLDFVVDPKNQRLIGNPEHGGEPMYDSY